MAVDLHTHSLHSDGSDSPEHLVRLAAEIRLRALALTDHDTLDGINEAAAAAAAAGVAFVPGVELSVDWEGRSIHILAYWIRPGPGPLQDRLAALQEGRAKRNREIVAALNGLGIDIDVKEVIAESRTGSAGRPHIAQILVRKGVVISVAEAFEHYLARGRPAYRERARLGVEEAAELTHSSGGVAVLAHPHTVADDVADFATVFERLATVGIDGIECHYAEYGADLRALLRDRATALGLIATGGSDYHGDYKPGLSLGSGRGDLSVPDAAYEALKAAVSDR